MMPHYKRLRNIAAGLAGTFVSRNNDIDGYWGMGVIYKEMVESGQGAITFNLLEGSVVPKLECGSVLLRKYRATLESMLHKQGLRLTDISTVAINVDFESCNNTELHIKSLGDFFVCYVSITDVFGVERSMKIKGRCRTHDPDREFRSTRRLPYPYFTDESAGGRV